MARGWRLKWNVNSSRRSVIGLQVGRKSFFFSSRSFFLLSLSVQRIALVVNLRACGLAFEDAATNPVTLSEERRERRKEVEEEEKKERSTQGSAESSTVAGSGPSVFSKRHLTTDTLGTTQQQAADTKNKQTPEELMKSGYELKKPFRWSGEKPFTLRPGWLRPCGPKQLRAPNQVSETDWHSRVVTQHLNKVRTTRYRCDKSGHHSGEGDTRGQEIIWKKKLEIETGT